MDYKKKYKEALERAKEKYIKCYSTTLLDYIFPELKSEDVEIRRSIIRNLKRYIKCIKDGCNASFAKDFVVKEIEKQIAWLEKQEEKKPTLPKWKYKTDNTPLLRDSLILNKYGCVAKSPAGAFVNDVWVIDYDELAKLPKEELEKQGKQETLCDKCRKEHPSHSCQDITELGRCSVEHEQKVEPKFHEGDWITNGDYTWKIVEVKPLYYILQSQDGNIVDDTISHVDEQFHSFTIQDAKEGDVLALSTATKRTSRKKQKKG